MAIERERGTTIEARRCCWNTEARMLSADTLKLIHTFCDVETPPTKSLGQLLTGSRGSGSWPSKRQSGGRGGERWGSRSCLDAGHEIASVPYKIDSTCWRA